MQEIQKAAQLTQLTDKQKQYVKLVCDEGLEPAIAAATVGIEPIAESDISIALAIRDRTLFLLHTQDAPAARKVLRELMTDTKNSAALRKECSLALLNRGGIPEPRAAAAERRDIKPPSEMNGDELRNAVEKLHGEMLRRAEGAKLIQGAVEPVPPSAKTQLDDMLG